VLINIEDLVEGKGLGQVSREQLILIITGQ
jgi:hypothetical protein